MRRSLIIALLIAAFAAAGCTGRGQASTSTSGLQATPPASVSAEPVGAASSAGAAATAAAEASGASPAATPAATPNPNLLDVANGTILRSYAPAALDRMNDGSLGDAAAGVGSELPSDAKPPYVFTFELPSAATIAEFQATLRGKPDNGPAGTIAFAVSTTGPNSGFTDIGALTAAAPPYTRILPAGKQARWVRVTANQLFDSVGATGSIAPPRARLDPTGFFVEEARPYKDGAFVPAGTSVDDARARFVAVGTALTATECKADRVVASYVGQFHDRAWTATFAGNKDANPTALTGVMNDEGTILAGVHAGGNEPVVFMRTSQRPAWCLARRTGTGAHHVLVLDQDPIPAFYPVDAAAPLPGYTLEAIGAGMLDASALAGKDAVITRGVCKLPDVLAPQQIAQLLQWAAAGHKLILGAAGCNNGADFRWLPFPFSVAGPGPETHSASLIQIENDALGTNDKNDAEHFVDALAYVTNANTDLPGANAMTTADPHWCGHFFVAKPTNINGFVQAYAFDGRGLLVYDGFSAGDDGVATLQRIRALELAAPVPAELPCSENVTESFVLEPSQEATFVAGKAHSLRAAMRVLANQGWSGHATVTTTGDLPATVTPAAFDIAGGTQDVAVHVNVPASAKAGVYTVNVVAANGGGKTAQASITLTGTAPLVNQLAPTQKRIRLYGIHFDVDSAHIQPRSEPVIAEIAQIMRSTPGLRFQVEGHTDSDGGAAYNLGLSQRRAGAVVADLVSRYQVAGSRLVGKGFGLTRPVASNATPAGKALNRRVELLRL